MKIIASQGLGTPIQDAVDMASSGDVIYVQSGNYDESVLLKDGVDFFFETGSIVEYTGATAKPVFYDAYYDNNLASLVGNNAPVRCNIRGYGKFNQSSTEVSGDGEMPVLLSSIPGTIINVECHSLTATTGASANAACVAVRGGNLTVAALDKIESQGYDAILSIAQPYSGEIHVTAPSIVGADDGCENSGAATIYIDANFFSGQNSLVNATSGNTYVKTLRYNTASSFVEDGGNIFVMLPNPVV